MRGASGTRPILPALLRLCVLVCGLCVMSACGDDPAPKPPTEVEADNGARPQRVSLSGAPASVVPPAGVWLVSSADSGPGQWYEQHRHAENGVTLYASRFPVHDDRRPASVLPRVVDAFVRSLGTEGFGQQTRGSEFVWGAPSSWLDFVAVVMGKRVKGRARLIRVSDEQWALAAGIAPDDSTAGARQVRAFVDSLEPTEPTFYERSFEVAFPTADIVVRPKGEEPVTRRQVAAVALVLEVATGQRFPLRARDYVMKALSAEARDGPPTSRKSFRETEAALDSTHDMKPKERLLGMRALGASILEALFARAAEGHMPAATYQKVWSSMGAPLVGTKKDGLSAAAALSWHEMTAFLASLAADRALAASDERGARLKEALTKRWQKLDKEARARFTDAGREWAALRYAWDRATPQARNAYRRAVLGALAGSDKPPAEGDDRALLTWMHAHAEANTQAYLERAGALSLADLVALRAHLGVDATGYELGW